MRFYLLLFVILLLCVPVIAEPDESYVFVDENATSAPTPVPTFNRSLTYRIDQGGCVQAGDTVDIAGLGWYTGSIVYCGRWYDGYGTCSNNSVAYTHKINAWNLSKVYLDPTVFSERKGWWYNYYNEIEMRGYDRLFYVADRCALTAEQNQTIVSKLVNESQAIARIIRNRTTLPTKTEGNADLIISKGITTNATNVPEDSHLWLFGRDDSSVMYDVPTIDRNISTFAGVVTRNLKSGEYDAVFITPGDNGIIEEIYNKQSYSISSPFRGIDDTSIYGFLDPEVKQKLIERMRVSIDDNLITWNIVLQDPMIEVSRIDTAAIPGNRSMMMISGYTNANPGDIITIKLDTDKADTRKWTARVVNNGGMRAYRSWNATFLMDFNNENPGQHDLTVSTDMGAKATAPFYIRRELAEHYKEETYLQFVDNSPFIPTPTPIIITKENQTTIPVEVIVTITIPVTPSQKSVDDATWASVSGIGLALVAGLVLAYLVLAYFRGRNV
jgi:hypothetical protein